MIKKTRQAQIMDALIKEEAITVTELAELLDVSTVTIRKDLTELEQANKLYRSHGKAIIINPFSYNRSINEKEKIAVEQKDAIVLQIHAGTGSVSQGILRQVNLHMGDLALVFLRLILGIDLDQLFYIKVSVVRPGDHCGTVIAGFPSHQHCCTGHECILLVKHLRNASRRCI